MLDDIKRAEIDYKIEKINKRMKKVEESNNIRPFHKYCIYMNLLKLRRKYEQNKNI